MQTRTLIFLNLILFINLNLNAQKRALTIEDTKYWNTINEESISNNGQWISYIVKPNKGDATLYLYNTENAKKWSFERGENSQIGYNNNLLIFKIKVQEDTLRQKKLEKVKKEDFPSDSLGIYFFDRDSTLKVEKFDRFLLPKKNSNWLAYMYEYKAPKDTSEASKDSSKTEQDSSKTKKHDQKGHRLVILDTKNMAQYIFDNIDQCAVSENGLNFIYTQNITDSIDTAKVWIFNTQKSKEELIFQQTGKSNQINISNNGEKMVFLFSPDTGKTKNYNLWLYQYSSKQLQCIANSGHSFMPQDFAVSTNQKPYFSDAGNRLYFGIAPKNKPEPKDSLTEDEKVILDIWAWTDKRLQPQQLKELDKDLKESFLYAYEIKTKQTFAIEDSTWRAKVSRKTEPYYYLAESIIPYQKTTSWEADIPFDFSLIDAKTGLRKTLALNATWDIRISPSGMWSIAWDQQLEEWLLINNKTLSIKHISNNIDDIFYNNDHDTPSLRSSYGIVGWSENEDFVYINAKYDIWQFSTNGKTQAICLTKGEGKKNNTEYRYRRLDKEEIYLPKEEWLLYHFNEETMEAGFDRMNPKSLERTMLFEGNYTYSQVLKAQAADALIWTKANFNTFPDLIFSNTNFESAKTISQANPQQNQFWWGKISLTEWIDYNGDTLKGLLILPENLDATKQYPVIVYFYEKYSHLLNVYWTPKPSHSTINFPFYTSNDYIVFVPDINYNTGTPGRDAYNAIISGVAHIERLPYVDSKHMGLQGQSWGGYQVAYLITQTNAFACAMAGAPVSNMTSAYGGIRWESGMSRMFQYEHTQSRIGGTLWERRDKYIENSPVFFADRVNTPLLIMHNDGDGAVPWNQGIEYFVALRRLNKPVWMLNYNGDEHNLMKWPNRVDLSIRMFSFFEHYLKGKEAPEWMVKGLPATLKGKTLRY
ncbi:MAG: S9 family peptidase [Bacteroidales bacterium]|nr:S9 family peptidase [Bacteroidales bacterium]